MKGLKRGLILGGGGLLLVAIVVANVSKGQGGRLGVQAEDAKMGDISSTVRAPAKVQPENMVKISANVTGEVVRLAVKEGGGGRKGGFWLQIVGMQYTA